MRKQNVSVRYADRTVASDIPSPISEPMVAEAAVLRVKAARFRRLAETLFDPFVIATAQACASELESEATLIERNHTARVAEQKSRLAGYQGAPSARRRCRSAPERLKAARARQRVIGDRLRLMYDEIAREQIPNDFLELLHSIDAAQSRKIGT